MAYRSRQATIDCNKSLLLPNLFPMLAACLLTWVGLATIVLLDNGVVMFFIERHQKYAYRREHLYPSEQHQVNGDKAAFYCVMK